MKTRWLLCSVAFLGILGSAGCTDGDGPTEPDGGLNFTGLNLTGAWTGTITPYDSDCASESISVVLLQEGTALSGNFRTNCQGAVDLRGEMNGNSISGTLSGASGAVRIGQVSGTASQTSIHITTWQSQARENGRPSERAVVNVIDLAR